MLNTLKKIYSSNATSANDVVISFHLYLKNKYKNALLINQLLKKFVCDILIYNSTEHTYTTTLVNIVAVAYYMKHSMAFKISKLLDLIVIDQLEEPRFKIVYNMISLFKSSRFFLASFAHDREEITSISVLFNSALWLEREIWDMFGIIFTENKDLRRILTDYGFRGYPLRKDFPLSGYLELWYDDDFAHTMYEPLRLAQQLRFFSFTTLWDYN